MGPANSINAWKGAYLIFALLLIVSCSPASLKEGSKACELIENISTAYESYLESARANPCGFLQVREPLLEVSGFLTAPAHPGAEIHLFITPELSFNSSIYVVENCPPILRKSLNGSLDFHLGPLPKGKYVAMLARTAFGETRGFPIVWARPDSNLSLKQSFHGGDGRYSIAPFEIGEAMTGAAETVGTQGEPNAIG